MSGAAPSTRGAGRTWDHHGAGALLLLLRLKLRGRLRQQWRRMKTLKGVILTALGVLLFGLWFASLAFSVFGPARSLDPAEAEPRVRLVGLLLTLLTLSSSLSHRGLFLPREEIERLFSAPVSRSDLVRYRLLSNSLRSLLGGVLIGCVSMRSLPNPPLALVGILLGMQTLPVLNQALSIALGGLEQRWIGPLRRAGNWLLGLVLLGLLALVVGLSWGNPIAEDTPLGGWLRSLGRARGGLLAHPVLSALTLPLAPWAHMIAATTLAEFLPWFLLCLVLYVLLFELCARLPIDFRELSLATSASVAARLSRARRGGGAAAGRASARAALWRVPWLFGRSPAGAIAWRKTAAIVRKAKGAFWVSVLALLFISAFSTLAIPDGEEQVKAQWTPVLFALLGTFYLCAGLRFDFREELERMEVIRAWPLAPAGVFLATLLPEVVVVSVLLSGAVLLQALLLSRLHPVLLGIVPCLPFLVLSWVALDNAVFLFAPVRVVPGHEGALQNAGRGLLLMFVRMLFLGLVLFLGGGAALAAGFGTRELLGWSTTASAAAAFAVLALALAALDLFLIWLGGQVLQRFDVARDRG